MKGRLGKFGFILLALALCLSITGGAFAHWSQTLYIEGTVETGELTVGLRDVGTNDPGLTGAELGDYYAGSLDPGFDTVKDVQVWYDKNVASINSENVNPKCIHGDVQFYHKEKITITNAYPSYAPGWTTEIANCGSIPVKISGIEITDPATGALVEFPCWIELLKWEKYANGEFEANGASHPILGYTMYGDQCEAELIAALAAQQLEPCDTISLYIELHTTQEFCEMPMNASFSFNISITFTQWNMV